MIGKALTKDAGLRYQTAADLGGRPATAGSSRAVPAWGRRRAWRRCRRPTSRAGRLGPISTTAIRRPRQPKQSVRSALGRVRRGCRRSRTSPARSSEVSRPSTRPARATGRAWSAAIARPSASSAWGAVWWMNRGPQAHRGGLGPVDRLRQHHRRPGVRRGTLNQALAVKLDESPYINVFPEERVSATPGAHCSALPTSGSPRPIGREVCQRQGIKAMMTGDIGRVGRELRGQSERHRLPDRRHPGTRAGNRGLQGGGDPGARRCVATKMRRGLGESLASIESATTRRSRSRRRPRWRLSRRSTRVSGRSGRRAAMHAADPVLRAGHRARSQLRHRPCAARHRATPTSGVGEPEVEEHRRRSPGSCASGVSALERLYIEAHYYDDIEGDFRQGQVETYEMWKQTPIRATGRRTNNLSRAVRRASAHWPKNAIENAQFRALELMPDNVLPLCEFGLRATSERGAWTRRGRSVRKGRSSGSTMPIFQRGLQRPGISPGSRTTLRGRSGERSSEGAAVARWTRRACCATRPVLPRPQRGFRGGEAEERYR